MNSIKYLISLRKTSPQEKNLLSIYRVHFRYALSTFFRKQLISFFYVVT